MEKTRERRSKSVSGIEGVHQIQKHRTSSRLSSESRAYYDESFRDDMFVLDLGQSSFRRATGRPELPAEDMYKQCRVHREQNMLSESFRQKSVSPEQLYDGRSNRRSAMKQQEFIDVHEDLESSGLLNPRRSSRWSRRSMLTKSDIEIVQKLKESKEQDDILNSKDLFMEYDRNRNYSVVNSAKFEGNSKAWMLERDNIGEIGRSDGSLLVEPHNLRRVRTSRKSSIVELEEKDNGKSTRIVVLRPNPGDMQSEGMSGSLPYDSRGYLSNYKKMKEKLSIGSAEKVSWRRKDSSSNVGFSRPVSAEATKIARKITRRMRGGCNEVVDSWFRKYVGEKDSYGDGDLGSDSENESEMFRLSSRNSFSDDKQWRMYPSSGSVEPSFRREAKKKVSERWKITQSYQELEIVDKGSTLGEMLGIPDGETRYKNHAKTNKSEKRSNDKMHRTSSRSRSLPPSVGERTHSRRTEEKHMIINDPLSCGKNKVGKGILSRKDYFSSQDLKCRNKKSLPFQHMYTSEIGSSSEANFEIQMEPNVKDLPDINRRSPVIIYERESTTTFSSKSSVLQPKKSSVIGDTDNAPSHDQKDFTIQELDKEPPKEGSPSLAYSEISKEADHASPVSVLAPSSFQGFEEVSAALNELRMQLQLLKMESDSYNSISTLVLIEDENAQLSSLLPKGWKLSYILDVLIHSNLRVFSYNMSVMTWHSTKSPLDPNLFDKLEKKYAEHEMNEPMLERKLLFDGINSTLLKILQQKLDLSPWVKPKLAALPLISQKERVVDALEKLINEESPNGQVDEKLLVDKEVLFQDSKGEINLLGNEIGNLLMDDMIIEILA
ncbi:hypothetical protein ACP275_12G137500 [Erythranthe tilingii]